MIIKQTHERGELLRDFRLLQSFSSSSPFFSDVEGVVDLQVALVIIIKKLRKAK